MKARTRHRTAVETAIKGVSGLTSADRPLIELARELARQMDAAGDDGPGTRLAATYLTTVRTLMSRLDAVTKPQGVSRLAQLRAARLEQIRSTESSSEAKGA